MIDSERKEKSRTGTDQSNNEQSEEQERILDELEKAFSVQNTR